MKELNDDKEDGADLLITLRTLVTELRALRVSIDDELWTFDDIAQYLKLSQYTVERRVVVQPNFLKPSNHVQRAEALKP